ELVDIDGDLRVIASPQRGNDLLLQARRPRSVGRFLGTGLLLAGSRALTGPAILRRQPAGVEPDRVRIGLHLCPPLYSVETVFAWPSKAARRVCQARVAHLPRTGNSRTPAKPASLPRPSVSGSACGSPVTRPWKLWNSSRASARVFPLRLSVIMEAD